MIRRTIVLAVLSLVVLPLAVARAGVVLPSTPPGALYFNEPNDTIQIALQTVIGTDSTYEARVYFPTGVPALGGIIFNEYTNSQEDKTFAAASGAIVGYNFPAGGGVAIQYSGAISTDAWHHMAFVQDSSSGEQRLYLDGNLVATLAAAGEVGDAIGPGHIGAISRDGVVATSFTGLIDTVRISDISRYSGASFVAPPGDLTSDANTLLLYNFNKPDFFVDQGAVKLTDLSGNNRTGTLGAGFSGATSPAPPGNHGDVDCSGGANPINSIDALKLLRRSASLSVSQMEPCPDIGEPLLAADFGDVDCDGMVNAIDALKILRFSASLSVSQMQPCPAFNDPV